MKSRLASSPTILLLLLVLGLPVPARALEVTVGPPITFASYGVKKAVFVERFRDGSLYVGLQHRLAPGPFGFRSTDGGQTWAEAPYAGIMLGQASDGTAMGFESRTRRGPMLGTFTGKVRFSRDGWNTVHGPQDIPLSIPGAVGGTGDDGRPFEGPIFWRSVVTMPSGDLLATMYGYFQGDTRYRSLVIRSADHGQSWAYLGTIAAGPNAVPGEGFGEPTLARLRDGALMAVMRTGWNSLMAAAWSKDNGRTWTTPLAVSLVGVDPDLSVLANGTVALGYGVKVPRSRWLAVSRDRGQSWHPTRISHGDGGTYPGFRETKPGTVLFVYEEGGVVHGSFIEVR